MLSQIELSIALPKGRLMDEVAPALRAAGLNCPDSSELDRRLVYESRDAAGRRVRFIMVRPSDVAAYVEHGAADLGVTGKDVLLEGDWSVAELLDLGFGRCRLAVAAPAAAAGGNTGTRTNGNGSAGAHVLRVATKFPNIAQRHFAGRRDVCTQIIKLGGAVEIAPITGLADVIVDIVETGRTLRENGLEVVEEIAEVSARLIANRASMQLKSEAIARICSALAARGRAEVVSC